MKTFPKPLSASEEKEYLERCKEGDQEAKGILILRNMRLVAHVVKKYQGTDYDMEDLISVGTVGLIKAINTFKMDKGSRLATYAAKCVENEVLMLLRAGKKYSREVSLFEPIGVDKDGETVSLVDVIETENKETIEDLILEQDVKELYQSYERCLKGTEKAVVGMRYGLYGKKEHTQREIAQKLGISRSYPAVILGAKNLLPKPRFNVGIQREDDCRHVLEGSPRLLKSIFHMWHDAAGHTLAGKSGKESRLGKAQAEKGYKLSTDRIPSIRDRESR